MDIIKTVIGFLLLFLALGSPTSSAGNEKWNKYKEALVKISTDPEYTKLWPEHIQQFQDINALAFPKTLKKNAFPCTPYSSAESPTSVHRLQPGDISVIGAMGDSITAGNGINAWTPIGALTEFRGHSWSVGGVETYEEVLTLPNILKKYNADITGFATGTGSRARSISKLNVAFPGNVAEHMPEQAVLLVERLRAMSEVDFENDWKMVTIFVGGNDLCDYCNDAGRYSVDKYKNYLQEALDILKADLPKAFVNVVAIFDVTPVAGLATNIICRAIHWAVCDCPKNAEPGIIRDIAMQYNAAVADLIATKRYDDKDDFTVIYQPFMRDNDVPRKENGDADMSFFCPDCFHFSGRGHEAIATMLWNGMFEPVGRKETTSPFIQDLYCPAQGEYFATVVNSRSAKDTGAQSVADAVVSINAAETPVIPSTSSTNLPLILGLTCSIGILAAVVLAALVVYKKKQTPMEDLTVLST